VTLLPQLVEMLSDGERLNYLDMLEKNIIICFSKIQKMTSVLNAYLWSI